MTKLFDWLPPQWAKNPLLDYELSNPRTSESRRGFVLQLLALASLLAGAAIIYATATGVIENNPNITTLAWQSLYFPTLLLQVLTMVAAFTLGATTFDAQRRSKTWDNLRVTEIGAGLALRARWIGILYRLRAPITAILLVRLLLALGTLVDLAAFGGSYAKILSAGAIPPLADWRISLLLFALNMTANPLLTLLMIASSAALGILINVAIKDRLFAAIIQIIFVVVQIVFISGASLALSQLLQNNLLLSDQAKFLLVFSYAGYGDWGLLLMHLGSLGEIWRRVPNGAFISIGLAILLLAQAIITDGMLWLAERMVERQS